MTLALRTYQRIECRIVREKAEEPYMRSMSDAASVARFLRPIIGSLAQESFVVVLLDARNRLIGLHVASTGTMTQAVVEPASVFRAALVAGAVSIAVAHNHPSSCPEPSADDVVLTRRLVEAGQVLGVPVLDHVVVTDSSHYSFAEHGLVDGR